MSKQAIASNVRDPENRSRKGCVCGGHSKNAKKKRRPWQRLRGLIISPQDGAEPALPLSEVEPFDRAEGGEE